MFVLYVLFSVAIFLLTLVGYHKYKMTTLYALAIGGIVNANFFHAQNYPIEFFGLPFGIDSILYTLFVFCVFVMYITEGKKQGYILAISSVVAIIISAAFQLFADLFSKGINAESFRVFAVFFVSAFATMVSIFVSIRLLEKIKEKTNKYLLLLIFMIVVSVVNTLIYCCLVDLVSNHVDNIFELLSASLIGKSIAIASSFVAFYLINVISKKKH